jgi:hypothetical protein
MAVQSGSPQQHPGAAAAYDPYLDDERGYGWVMFAGVLLLVVGTINFIEGIAAIGNAHFFVGDANYVFGSLNTWGWVALCIGVIQWAVAIGVFFKNQIARWAGVVILGLNLIAQLLTMPAYPFWSLSVLAMDIVALYGLIAYGKRIGAAS